MSKQIAEQKKKKKNEQTGQVGQSVSTSLNKVKDTTQKYKNDTARKTQQRKKVGADTAVTRAANTVAQKTSRSKKAVEKSTQQYQNRVNKAATTTANTSRDVERAAHKTIAPHAAPKSTASRVTDVAKVAGAVTNQNADIRAGELQRLKNIEADRKAEQDAQKDIYHVGKGKWTGEWTNDEIEVGKRGRKRLETVVKNTPKEILNSYDIALTQDMSDEEREYMRQFLSDEDLQRIDYYNDKRLEKRMKRRDELQAETNEAIQGAESNLERWILQGVQSGEGMAMDQAFNVLLPGAWTVSMGARTMGSQRGVRMKEVNDSLYKSAIENGMSEEDAADYVARVGMTEQEDFNYIKAQAAKEIFTEYIFQGYGIGKQLTGGKSLISPERLMKILPQNILGRAVGGGLEESAEEWIGMMLDPYTEEYSYDRNIRKRQAQYTLEKQLDQYRAMMADPQSAQSVSLILNDPRFIEQQKNSYMKMGFDDEKAEYLAEQTREYITADITGDVAKRDAIEKVLSRDISDINGLKFEDVNPISKKNFGEFVDTTMSTFLLTMGTGLPSAFTTSEIGRSIRDSDGGREQITKWTGDILNGSTDAETASKVQAMNDRMESGKALTGTQVFDLSQMWAKDTQERQEEANTSNDTAQNTIRSEGLEQASMLTINDRGEAQVVHNPATNEAVTNKTAEAFEIVKETRGVTEEDASAEDVQDAQTMGRFLESGMVTASDSRIVDYGNVEGRQLYERMTGEDLSQYDVYKDGKIDIPATNKALRSMFYAKAAQNQIVAARRETEFRKDQIDGEIKEVLRPSMAANGNAALTEALQSIDSRDWRKTDLVSNAFGKFYRIGKDTTMTKEEALRMYRHLDVDRSILESAYDAGANDYIEGNTPANNQVVQAGAETTTTSRKAIVRGQFTTDFKNGTQISGSLMSVFEGLAKALNMNIVLTDDLATTAEDATGSVKESQINGLSESDTRTITLNVHSGAEQNLSYTLMHELTHQIRTFAPKEYQILEDLIFDKWLKMDPAEAQRQIDGIMETYRKARKPLKNDSQAREEIVCNAMAEAINDKKFIDMVCSTNTNLGRSVLNAIRSSLRSLRNLFLDQQYHTRRDEAYHNALLSRLGILDEAERLWLDALAASYENQAAQGIEQWANNNAVQQKNNVRESLGNDYEISGDKARWTDERIDRLMQEYGASNPNYSKAYAVLMNPRDFLKLTLEDSEFDRWNDLMPQPYVYPLIPEDLAEERQTPFLKIRGGSDNAESDGSFRIEGHEGRHRMRALYESGIRSVPIVIIDSSEATKYSKQHLDNLTFASQDYYDLKMPVNFDARVEAHDLVPITRHNRDELIEKFGGKAKVSFSITPQMDADYMSAVESGDMETAQRMVDEAARRAGYYVEAWHQTAGDFTVFNTDNPQAAKNDSETPNGIFFKTNDHDIGLDGKKQLHVYLKPGRTLSFKNREEANQWYRRHVRNYENLDDSKIRDINVINGPMEQLEDLMFGEGVTDEEYDRLNEEWDSMLEEMRTVEDNYRGQLRDLLNDYFLNGNSSYDSIHLGYDGHRYVDGKRENVETYIVFNGEQAKLADPVTYDDKGNVIPLSERFNTAEQDIRYSLPSYTQEEMDEHRRVLEEDMRDNYGDAYTEDYSEAGYVFPNGKMLKMGTYGVRGDDHAIAGLAYDDVGYDTYYSPKAEAQKRFINEGNIRWMPENGWLNFGTNIEPTAEQYQWIEDAVYDYGISMIEFTDDDNNTVDYKEYDAESESADEVINDIKRFYRDGKIGGSQLSQFRYSYTTENEALPKGAAVPNSLKKWADDIGLDTLSNQSIKGPVIVSVKNLRTSWYDMFGRSDEGRVVNKVFEDVGRTLTAMIGQYNYIDLSDSLNATVHYRTDAEGNPTSVILTCQVKNAEYEINFDFTTICSKRSPMQKVLERFIKTEGEHLDTLYDELKLDEEGMYKLRLILEQAGFEVSCKGCFVEQNRYSQQAQAKTVANDWNAALDQWAKDHGTEITENFNLKDLDINTLDYDEIARGFERYHELMKDVSPNVENKNRALIESTPLFRKRMNPSDYASLSGQRALMAMGEPGGTNLYNLLKRGQGYAKQTVPFTAYNGEIALLPDNVKGKNLAEYLLSIGGARAQSASDFQIEHIYDYMQMVADLAARKLPMHMYTKVMELAELFGMTGIKINLSAMCDVDPSLDGEHAGLKLVNGKYEYNISDQSIDYPRAVELQKRDGYSKNIGIIMVVLSKEHMLKSLSDNDVRYIIGYHSSKMPGVVAKMSAMGNATDYTKINKTNKLNDKGRKLFNEAMDEAKGEGLEKYKDALRIFDDKIQADKKGKQRRGNEYSAYMSAYKGNTADFDTYGDIKNTNDARKTADNYLQYCMDNDLIPMYFPFAFHENYYKCEVFDFNMYDNVTGEYAPMEAVQNVYPGLNMANGETDTTAFMNRVSEMMSETNEKNEAVAGQYDKVVERAKQELSYSITGNDYMDIDGSGIDHSELQHRADFQERQSITPQMDADYMSVVESGDMETARKLVEQAANKAGFDSHVYSGTDAFGYTVIDDNKADDKNTFWAADLEEGAGTYTSYGKVRRISESNKLSEDSLDSYWEETSNKVDEEIQNFRNLMDVTFSEWYFGRQNNSMLRETFDSSNPDPGNGDGIYDELEMMVEEAYEQYEDDFSDKYEDYTSWREDSPEAQELFDTIWSLENLKTRLNMIETGSVHGGVYELYANTDNMYVLDAEGRVFNGLFPKDLPKKTTHWKYGEEEWDTEEPYRTREVANWARDNGYSGVIFKNILDNGIYGRTQPITVYTFFNAQSQVKSADPVTYAKDGSVIPLSERFNPENDDIRYSMPTTDSDGNVLSDDQMEYFKNSKARDEQGRLVPVYHGTTDAWFTTFKTNYARDGRTIFFTSMKRTASSYARSSNPVDVDPYNIDTSKKYIKIRNVYDLADTRNEEEERDQMSRISNIRVWDNDGGKEFASGDNFIEVARDIALKLEESGIDLYDEIGIRKDDLFNDFYMYLYGEAWELYNQLSNVPGHFFEYSMDFETNVKSSGVYTCYLDLTNPLIVDAGGAYWNAIPYDESEYTTNQLAEIAQNNEYDGLIVRNVIDYATYGYGNDPSDVYIAFKSNQVKDVRNENPTENPDIRWSFTPENEIGNENVKDIEALPSDDPKIEEGRSRTARSKENFFRSRNAKWRPEWKTEGRVLKESSVKKNIQELIIGAMRNSNTTHQYRTGLVNEAMYAARQMYDCMKTDRVKDASKIAMDTADKIVENLEFIDDSTFERYKELKAYLKDNTVKIPQDIVAEFGDAESWNIFRKHNLNRIRMSTTDGIGLDSVYDEMVSKFKDLFNPDEKNPAEQIKAISTALDALKDYTYVLDEQDTIDLRDYIASQLFDIVAEGEEYKSLVDKHSNKIDRLTKSFKQRLETAQEKARNEIDRLRESVKREQSAKEKYGREAWLATERAEQAEQDVNAIKEDAERERQTKETFGRELWKANERVEQAEQRAEVLEENVKRERKTKEKFGRELWKANERVEQAEQRKVRLKAYGHIYENYNWLCDRVLDPTVDKHVPEEFRRSLAEMLQLFDLQTERSKSLEAKTGKVAQKTFKMRELRSRLDDFAKTYEEKGNLESLDANMAAIADALADRLDGKSIDSLETADIINIDKLLSFTKHIMQNYNKVRILNKQVEISEIGGEFIKQMMELVAARGIASTYKGPKGAFDMLVNMEEVTPIYFFGKLGRMYDMYSQLRNVGFDKYIRNTKMISDHMQEILGKYYKTNKKGKDTKPGSELDSWRDMTHAQTFELKHGAETDTITMSPAQIMSLYCLWQRQQAKQHILMGGIAVTPIQTNSKIEAAKEYLWKGNNDTNTSVLLNENDVKTILAALTPEQINVAEKLQNFMANEMAALGNEAQMEMYGYKAFNDPNYFPIRSSDDVLIKDVNTIEQTIQKIKSFGPAKPLVPNANNKIVVDDIFSVVAEHCNGMNLYNAYLVPISDFMKMYNYKEGELNVRDALEKAYSKKALTYINNFMSDINGIKQSSRGGMDNLMNSALGKAKTAAVFGNVRVFLQQPTAIARALAVLDAKYFKGAAPSRKAMQEMFEHCPIAYWKSIGNYEMHMGRDIEDIMMNKWSVSDRLLSDWYGLADNRTWSSIWGAVKNEVKEKNPKVEVGSEEFWNLCNKRMSEVVDKTQVVDSAFHRSNMMRNKQLYAKVFTSFMAEPTLTFNVLRDGIVRAHEAKQNGDASKAGAIIGRTFAVLMLQQALLSVAQAIVDGWRGKRPKLPWEDDDDLLENMKKAQLLEYAAEHNIEIPPKAKKAEVLAAIQDAEHIPGLKGMLIRYADRVGRNTVYNFFESGRYWNNLYIVKEFTPYIDYAFTMVTEKNDSMFMKWFSYAMGWDQTYLQSPSNLLYSNWESAFKGFGKIVKESRNEEPEGNWYDRYYDPLQKFSSGIAAVTGLPFPTIMRDTKPIWDFIHENIEVEALDSLEPEKEVPTITPKQEKPKQVNAASIPNAKNKTDEKDASQSSGPSVQREVPNAGKQIEINKRVEKFNTLHEREQKALEKVNGITGEERTRKIYEAVTDGYTASVAEGDYGYLAEMRNILQRNGCDVTRFDNGVLKATKSEYKKTLTSEKDANGNYIMDTRKQSAMRQYMLSQGMTEADVSDLVYHSYMAKDLKAAFRLNNEEYIMNELVPLVHAGLTYEDFEKLYKYRNRFQNYDGKYKNEFKSSGKLTWPITGTITSGYGYRGDIGLGTNPMHYGIDIGANMGDPVGAADGGQVVFAGWNDGFGNQVVIRHDNGTETYYSHLSGFAVHQGDTVGKGQSVGQVGSTGQSTGPHLDFRVKVNGEYVNPMDYLSA